MKEPTDVEVIEKAAPYIRSIVAFVVFLSKRHDATRLTKDEDAEVDRCYETADGFLGRLKADLQKGNA